MSHGITPMNTGQGFTSNLATTALVLAATPFGLPVPTTHVSNGALSGLGLARGRAGRWKAEGSSFPSAGTAAGWEALGAPTARWLFIQPSSRDRYSSRIRGCPLRTNGCEEPGNRTNSTSLP